MTRVARRRVLGALAALPAASACAPGRLETPAAEPAAPGRAPSWKTSLTPEQALTLEDVAEQLIPETDTPGARAAGVPELIESMLRDVLDEAERRAFLHGIAALNARATTACGRPFPACDPAEQRSVLESLATDTVARLEALGESGDHDALEPESRFWLQMRDWTIEGFACSRPGATLALAYDPIPGEYEGCVPFESVGKTWAL